jgi:hypothetical protein
LLDDLTQPKVFLEFLMTTTLKTQVGRTTGSPEARRLRGKEHIPAVLYGMGMTPRDAVRDMMESADAECDRLSARHGELSPPIQRLLDKLRLWTGEL